MDIINLDHERYNNVCSRLYNLQTLLENEYENLVSQFENQTCESMMPYNEKLENLKSSINDIKDIVVEMSGFEIGQKIQYYEMSKIKNGIIKPGTYKVVFTENELNDIDPDNIYINFLVRKDGEEIYNIR